LTIDVQGEEATLDLQVSEAPEAVARTLGERIALIKGVRPALPGGSTSRAGTSRMASRAGDTARKHCLPAAGSAAAGALDIRENHLTPTVSWIRFDQEIQ
jgi:hypothetical protein